MKLLFLGDIVFDATEITVSQNLLDLFNSADYKVCNFEGSFVSPNSNRIIKAGPHVSNSELALDFIKKLNVNYAALANNHIMDYGVDSLVNTINVLNDNGIETLGAGKTYTEAYNPLIISNNKEKICIINACQAEFGVVKNKYVYGGGYAWVNSPAIKQKIKENLEICDKVILFLHAGMEDQIIPLPEWKQIYHEFADIIGLRGAIIATHPHIVQGYEIYNGTPIFYSLGNFSFFKEELKDNIEWNRGIVVQYDTLTNETKVIPVLTKEKFLDIDNSDTFKSDMEYRCKLVKDEAKLNEIADAIAEKSWNDFYKSYYQSVTKTRDIESYSGWKLIKILIKKFFNKLFRTNFNIVSGDDFDETMLLHNIQIESHRFCVERYLYNRYIACKHN